MAKHEVRNKHGDLIGTIEEQRPDSPESTEPYDPSAHPIETGLTHFGVTVFTIGWLSAVAAIAYFVTYFVLKFLVSTRGDVDTDMVHYTALFVSAAIVLGFVIKILSEMTFLAALKGLLQMIMSLVVSAVGLVALAGIGYALYKGVVWLLDKMVIR